MPKSFRDIAAKNLQRILGIQTKIDDLLMAMREDEPSDEVVIWRLAEKVIRLRDIVQRRDRAILEMERRLAIMLPYVIQYTADRHLQCTACKAHTVSHYDRESAIPHDYDCWYAETLREFDKRNDGYRFIDEEGL